MTTNIPEQPAAPDYSKATQEGIYTDIDTLPIRNKIAAAQKTGSAVTYTDPRTGEQKTADFRGQTDWDSYAKTDAAAKWLKDNPWKDAGYKSRDDALQDYYNNIGSANGDKLQYMNSGSDAEMQRIATQSALDANDLYQHQQLKLREELGVKNAEQTRKELEATDPEGFKARDSLVAKLRSDMDSPKSDIKANTSMGEIADRMKGLTASAPGVDSARFGKLYGQISSADSGKLGQLYDQAKDMGDASKNQTAAARKQLLDIAQADAARGAKLDDATRNEVIQSSRAAMAARGNFLGNSAAVAEAQEVGEKGEQRRLAALQRLASAQQQGYTQETGLLGQMQGLDDAQYGRNTNAITMESNLLGQQFGQQQAAWNDQLQGLQGEANYRQAQASEDRATRQENYGRDQQKLSNISAMILGQPISNQFGNLGAAQQGAVGFNNVGYKSGVSIDPSAGANSANFAQQNYSQAASMWNTRANIAQQDNAAMNSMISGGAGMALGAMM